MVSSLTPPLRLDHELCKVGLYWTEDKYMNMASLNVAVSVLRRVVSDLSVLVDGRDIPDDTLDSFIVSLEFVYRELIVLEATSPLNTEQLHATDIVRNSLSTLRSLNDLRSMPENHWHSRVHPVSIGLVGRPCFQIPRDQLSYLIENGFSVPQIADMIGVSVRTVRRRMDDYGLSIRAQCSALSDPELDAIVTEIQSQFPMCGNRQMQGHLLARGHRVQQIRVREAQRRVDPQGTIIRRLHALN